MRRPTAPQQTQRRNRMRTIAAPLVIALLPCTGCMAPAPAPEAVVPVSNTGYSVERLFTDDRGNTIYRFWDAGQSVYYASGPGGARILGTPAAPSTDRSRVDAN